MAELQRKHDDFADSVEATEITHPSAVIERAEPVSHLAAHRAEPIRPVPWHKIRLLSGLTAAAAISAQACGSPDETITREPVTHESKEQAGQRLLIPSLALDRRTFRLEGAYPKFVRFQVSAIDSEETFLLQTAGNANEMFHLSGAFKQPVTGYEVKAFDSQNKEIPISIPAEEPDGIQGQDHVSSLE